MKNNIKSSNKFFRRMIIILIILLVLLFFTSLILRNRLQDAEPENVIDSNTITAEEIEQNELEKQMEEIENSWKEKYEKLAYYIEHDELEKVGTEFTKLKADITTKEYATAVENLENCQL